MSFTGDLEKLGEAEVRKRLQGGGIADPGSQNYLFAQEWLRNKERERKDTLNARQEAREEESLSISPKALPAEGTVVTGSETATIVRLFPKGSDKLEELSCTPSLAQLLALAARIARKNQEDSDISFSSILIAFLYSNIPLSRWFNDYVREAQIDVDPLLSKQNLHHEELSRIANQPITENELAESWRQTSSARLLLQSA